MKINLEPGGEITLKDDKKYRIIDIIEINDKKYIFCSTTIKPIIPVIFQYREKNNNIQFKIENDRMIIEKIFKKVYENGMRELEEES